MLNFVQILYKMGAYQLLIFVGSLQKELAVRVRADIQAIVWLLWLVCGCELYKEKLI
jgi:hypothetical protein